MPGPGGVVSALAQLLLRGQHQQHDLLLVGREGLLCPDPLPQARPHQLGGREEKQLLPVSWTGQTRTVSVKAL